MLIEQHNDQLKFMTKKEQKTRERNVGFKYSILGLRIYLKDLIKINTVKRIVSVSFMKQKSLSRHGGI